MTLKNKQPINQSFQITPELAANVVKDYILPMFDNEGKKYLKRKGAKSKERPNLEQIQDKSLSGATAEEREAIRLKEIQALKNSKVKNSVYAEMKLSKILQDQIDELKNEILNLKETI